LKTGSVHLGWAAIPASRIAATLAVVEAMLLACDLDYQDCVRMAWLPDGSHWRRKHIPINRDPVEHRMCRLGHIARRLFNWPHFVAKAIVQDHTGLISATTDPFSAEPLSERDTLRIGAWLEVLPEALASPFLAFRQTELRRFGQWLDCRQRRVFEWGWDPLLDDFLAARGKGSAATGESPELQAVIKI
jgi:hypothetical protein